MWIMQEDFIWTVVNLCGLFLINHNLRYLPYAFLTHGLQYLQSMRI